MPGLVEADDDGLYVAKFRGAGQGLRALVAEVIVGELARARRSCSSPSWSLSGSTRGSAPPSLTPRSRS